MVKLVLTLLAGALLGALAVGAAFSTGLIGGGEVRVSVRPLEDGRSEVAVQFRQADGAWGERIRPERRFVPPDAAPRRWLNSSALPLPAAAPEPLKLGMLGVYSGPFGALGAATEHGATLAIQHINAAGGVFGRPVELIAADTGGDDETAAREARRLVEQEGVHAFVGPLTSHELSVLGETIAPELQVPFISPSASSPVISFLNDDGFVFRTIISDAALADALAQLAEDEGYDELAVVYRDDFWGRHLHRHFVNHYTGDATSVALTPDGDDYAAQIAAAAAGGARTLVLITAPQEAQAVLAAALEQDRFDNFLFEHTNRSQALYDAYPQALEGAKGIGYSGRHLTEAEGHWEADYRAAFGAEPLSPFARETYDAALSLMLAAAQAGSTDGAAIRDALYTIADAPGRRVPASAAGAAQALRAIAAGEDINLDGEATALDWDEHGDILRGHVVVWQFAEGGIREISNELITIEADRAAAAQALTIGYLSDYSGPVAEFGPELERAARLAVKHLNQGGGVLGREVRLVIGDTGLDAARSVEQARGMLEVEGVQAIVAALAADQVIAVAESVAAPAEIPIISPTATAVPLAAADDDDFLFRTTISDATQGPVLARLAGDEGYANVAILYIDDLYGRGLSEAFLDAWDGGATAIPIQGGEQSYREKLNHAAAGGAPALIAIAYPGDAAVFVREALDNDIFDRFLFVDATRSLELLNAVGAERLEGMSGTAPASDPDSASLAAFNAAYQAEYGELPSLAFAHETYDAVIALGLAAAAAHSTDGAALRDRLRDVTGAGGEVVQAGPAGVAAALRALRNGEAVNYEGAGASLDWDAAGDLARGRIGVWQFADGRIREISSELITLGAE